MIPITARTKALLAPVTDQFNEDDFVRIHSGEDDSCFHLDFYRLALDRKSKTLFRTVATTAMLQVRERLPEKAQLLGAVGEPYYSGWRVPSTDLTVEIIAQLVPPANRWFMDDDAKELFNYIHMQSLLADQCANVIAAYKENGHVPQHPYEMNAERPLIPYQQSALICQQAQDGFGLLFEQGCGKTPTAIAGVCNSAVLHRANGGCGMFKVLIVVPNNVKRNWVDEFGKFATRPGRVTILKGTPTARIGVLADAFAEPEEGEDLYFTAVICGYQTLWRTWEHMKFCDWDMAILDEAHMIRNIKAAQSEGCMVLRDHSKQRMILTGTPIANSPLDIYNLLEFMDKNGSGFSSYTEFKRYYGTTQRMPSGHDVLTGFKNLAFLQERLMRKTFIITSKEALPHLPEKMYDVLEVDMTAQQRDLYRTLSNQLAIEIDETLSNDGINRSMLVSCILTKLLRLSQITSGFLAYDKIVDEDGELRQPGTYEYLTPNPKIEAILDLIRDKPPTDKTVIWAHWIPDIEYLSHCCTELGIDHAVFRGLHKGYTEDDRQEALRRYNEDPNCKVFIGTQKSGGVGLNLLGYPPHQGDNYDTDTTHVIYMSQNWSYIDRDQSEKRGHRSGTRRPVRYTTVICSDSIDEDIHDRVSIKKVTAFAVADMRPLIKAILTKSAVLA